MDDLRRIWVGIFVPVGMRDVVPRIVEQVLGRKQAHISVTSGGGMVEEEEEVERWK
jgi:hypothetical protein